MKSSNQTLQEGSSSECLAGRVLSRCFPPFDDICELCSNLRFSNLTQSTVDAAMLQCQGNPHRPQEEEFTVAFLEIVEIGLVEQGTQIKNSTVIHAFAMDASVTASLTHCTRRRGFRVRESPLPWILNP